MAVTAPQGSSWARSEAGHDPLFRVAAAGVGVIWAAVIVITIFSPDSVSGSEHDHVPIAAVVTWVWGLIASRSIVTTLVGQRHRPERVPELRRLVGWIGAIWVVAAATAVLGPEIVTGADPTRVPIAALVAPIAALVATTTACQVYSSLHDTRQP